MIKNEQVAAVRAAEQGHPGYLHYYAICASLVALALCLGLVQPGASHPLGPPPAGGADELVDDLSGGFALNVCRQFNSAIIALRSRGQNDKLGVGKSWHRDPPVAFGAASFAATTAAPPWPCSRRGRSIPRLNVTEISTYD